MKWALVKPPLWMPQNDESQKSNAILGLFLAVIAVLLAGATLERIV